MKERASRLTSAHAIALAALFVALSGSAYAALNVTSADVVNRTLVGKDMKKNALKGSEVDEAKLKPACPQDMALYLGLCIETAQRAAQTQLNGEAACDNVGRRLPHWFELYGLGDEPGFDWSDSELTVDVFTDNVNGEQVYVMSDMNARSAVALGTAKPFRCVEYPRG